MDEEQQGDLGPDQDQDLVAKQDLDPEQDLVAKQDFLMVLKLVLELLDFVLELYIQLPP